MSPKLFRPICWTLFLLLGACDGSSYESVTAPTPATSIPVALTAGSYAGTVTIQGVGSHDPGGDCVADAILRDVGRTWSFQMVISDPSGGASASGHLSTPLLDCGDCRLRFQGVSRDELWFGIEGGSELTYATWVYGAGCAAADTELEVLRLTLPKPVQSVGSGALLISGTGGLMFERRPMPSYDLDVVVHVELQRH